MSRTPPIFDYETAFSRNRGLLTERDQQQLRSIRVGVPGLGGVGGGHALALARLGAGAFSLADPDHFEVVNLNRQPGATLGTVGRSKVEVTAEMVADINPETDVRVFRNGLALDNLDEFLAGVDLVVDGIEFFRIRLRRALYRRCHERGIPVVNAGPIGYGVALQVFLPGGPTFDAYFGIDDRMTRAEQLLAFGLGLGPGLSADIDPACTDFEREKGPVLGPVCMLASGLAACEVLKWVTGKAPMAAVPEGRYYDPLRGCVAPLNPPVPLTTDEGRRLRDLCFRRFPALRAMHEHEEAGREVSDSEADDAGRFSQRNSLPASSSVSRSSSVVVTPSAHSSMPSSVSRTTQVSKK